MSQVDVAVNQAQRGAKIMGETVKFCSDPGDHILYRKTTKRSKRCGPIFGVSSWVEATSHPSHSFTVRCLESLWSWSKGLQCRCPRGSWELHGDHKQFDWETKLILQCLDMFGWKSGFIYIIMYIYIYTIMYIYIYTYIYNYVYI